MLPGMRQPDFPPEWPVLDDLEETEILAGGGTAGLGLADDALVLEMLACPWPAGAQPPARLA